MDFNNSDQRFLLFATIVSIAAVALVIAYARRRIAKERLPPRHAEVARMTEEIEWTSAGSFCLLLLMLHQAGSFYFFIAAKSAIQEAAAAAVWIGGNVLWGLGVALGRRRLYRIWRELPREEPPVR